MNDLLSGYIDRLRIMCQSKITGQAFLWVIHMPFKLIAEMPYRCSHGPRSRIAQRTNGITLDLALDIPKQVNVGILSFSTINIFQDLFHPAGSFTTGTALPAAFMAVE